MDELAESLVDVEGVGLRRIEDVRADEEDLEDDPDSGRCREEEDAPGADSLPIHVRGTVEGAES